MSKNISLSDDVYDALKREKGNRSFSDVIREKLESGSKLADVTGEGVLDAETYEAVKADIGQLSNRSRERFEDETA